MQLQRPQQRHLDDGGQPLVGNAGVRQVEFLQSDQRPQFDKGGIVDVYAVESQRLELHQLRDLASAADVDGQFVRQAKSLQIRQPPDGFQVAPLEGRVYFQA